jgi:hypothetical protein
MTRHRFFYAAAVAALTLGVAVVTSTGTAAHAAQAGHTIGAVRTAPAPHKVNLHAAFEHALSKTRHSYPEAGIVPARDKKGSGIWACTEPACDMSWQGGPVQHSPHVYILLWGPNWTSSDPGYGDVYWMFDSLGQSNDGWSTTTSQYCDSSGCPSFTGSVLQGAWQDSSTPPNPVTGSDLAAEANSLVSDLGITDTADAQIVVMSQSGTCFSDGFAGNCGSPGSGSYCAWHSYSGTVSYTNLPYQLDAQGACGENWINSGSAGTYDGFSTVGGHEYAESVTDPQLNAWYDPAVGLSGEIGDKCAWASPNGDVSLTNGTFAMQSLWSNDWGQCVMTSSPYLDIFSPGNQSSLLGSSVSLGISTASNTDMPLSFGASNLPLGLHINSATGIITGIPVRTAGTYTATIVVSDYADISSTQFTWSVSSSAGQMKGYDAKCVDDYHGLTTNGNKIDLYTCNGTTSQSIVFHANGELIVRGKCITSLSGKEAIETCTHATTQTWTRSANGEYIVKSNNQCLTDPKASKANFTQLVLAACANNADQHWSLP